MSLDALAIFAHRDDAELTCGGTLAKLARLGHRVGILDLTQGEMGTRGSAATRAEEASQSAAVLGVALRENLEFPDAGIVASLENRARLANVIRRHQPRLIFTHAPTGRHPDHTATTQLVRDACFVAGLAKVAPDQPPHRPLKILHAIAYREDNTKPTFVVDISDDFETKLRAIQCFASQFDDAVQAGELYPNGEPLYDLVRHQAVHYGSLIRCRYGEPFFTAETVRVDDPMSLEVSSL